MLTIESSDLASVSGGAGIGQVFRDLPGALNVPLGQTRQATIDFINNHSFFHQGLMDAPIGGGKHFRNVPFIGPARTALGALSGNALEVAKGIEVTRGTWAAP